MWVVSSICQRTDTNAISLILVISCEVNLLLRCSPLRDSHGSLQYVSTGAAGCAENHCAKHECRRQNALATIRMDGACDMSLRDVCYFMGQYTSEFVFVATCFDEPCMDSNVAARECESVDVRIIDNKKSELVITIVGLSGDTVPNFVYVFGDLWSSTTFPLRRMSRIMARPICDSVLFVRIASAGLPISGSLMSSAPAPLVKTTAMVASSNKVRLINLLINDKYSTSWVSIIRPHSLVSVQHDNAFKHFSGMPFYLNAAPFLAKLTVCIDKKGATNHSHELAAI